VNRQPLHKRHIQVVLVSVAVILAQFNYHIHQQMAVRGEANSGVLGLECATCHSNRNFTLLGEARIKAFPDTDPGHLLRLRWHGKANQSVISAANSRTRRAMVVVASFCCAIT
jgi:hypothetical protein